MLDVPEFNAAGPGPTRDPSDIFDQIISRGSLASAFEFVAREGDGAGGDGIGVRDHGEQLERRIAILSDELAWGYYRPGPVHRFQAVENNGEARNLAMLCVTDMIVQVSALAHLGPLLGQEDLVPCRGPGAFVDTSIQRIGALYHQGFRYLVDANIVQSLNAVPHARVLDLLAKFVSDQRIVSLAAGWLDLSGTPGFGLLDGAPISRLFARAYLDGLDERLCGKELRIVRFADDLLLLACSRAGAERELVIASEKLGAHGLVLHPGKASISSIDESCALWGRAVIKSFAPFGSAEGDRQWTSAAAAAAAGAATPSQQFRNRDFGTPTPLQASLPPVADGAGAGQMPPRTGVLYLSGRERTLDRRELGFSVIEQGREIWRRAASSIERIELGTASRVTDQAMQLALATRTPIFFLDEYGATQGMLGDERGSRADLHLAQARLVADPAAKLALARELVHGQVYNRRRKLQVWRLNKRRSARIGVATADRSARVADAIQNVLPQMRRWQDAARHAASFEELAQIEAAAANVFRRLMRLALDRWSVNGRRRRPASASVAAVLNWLASLMARDFRMLIARHGLHPGFPLLHDVGKDIPSLASDLMEEFRAPVCDGLALTLFNRSQLGPHHFFVPVQDPQGRTWITPEGRNILIREYETFVRAPSIARRDRKGRTSWRGAFEVQVLALIAHVEGRTGYTPYKLDM